MFSLRSRLTSLFKFPFPSQPSFPLTPSLTFAASLPTNPRNASFSSPSSPYLSVRIKCPQNIADMLSEALLCFGASSASMDEGETSNSLDEVCISSIFTGAQDVESCISHAADSIGLTVIPHYEVTTGEECDWVTNSQETFHPVEVTDKLWVIPVWRTPPNIQAMNIILNPGLAFGTGEHPTTKLCLQLLYRLIKGGESFLDYGTGSGVLSIAALKLGAALSVGVDIDPQAIISARQNATLNDVHLDKMHLYLGSHKVSLLLPDERIYEYAEELSSNEMGMYSDEGKYDIVIANILLNPLLELADQIWACAKPGGVIGVSGIISEQIPRVEECYSKYLDDLYVSEMDGWACISGRKKKYLCEGKLSIEGKIFNSQFA